MRNETMAYSFSEASGEVFGHWCQIVNAFSLKAAIATLPTLFSAYLMGDWYIFELWFIMNFCDLALGVTLACTEKKFSRRRLYGWVTKTLAHTITIILVGVLTFAFSTVSGVVIPVLDWFMFILILTEIASIFNSLGRLGLPIHPVAKSLVEKLRRKSESKIDSLINENTDGKEDNENGQNSNS